jgi:hypothetical protein
MTSVFGRLLPLASRVTERILATGQTRFTIDALYEDFIAPVLAGRMFSICAAAPV